MATANEIADRIAPQIDIIDEAAQELAEYGKAVSDTANGIGDSAGQYAGEDMVAQSESAVSSAQQMLAASKAIAALLDQFANATE